MCCCTALTYLVVLVIVSLTLCVYGRLGLALGLRRNLVFLSKAGIVTRFDTPIVQPASCCLHLLLDLELVGPDVGSGRRAQLVDLLPLLPHARPSLHDGDDLLGYPSGELLASTAL